MFYIKGARNSDIKPFNIIEIPATLKYIQVVSQSVSQSMVIQIFVLRMTNVNRVYTTMNIKYEVWMTYEADEYEV